VELSGIQRLRHPQIPLQPIEHSRHNRLAAFTSSLETKQHVITARNPCKYERTDFVRSITPRRQGVSLDELAGRKDVRSETAIKNPELNRLCAKVDHLSDEDQKALVIVLDSLVKRSKVSKEMAEAGAV